MTAELAKGWKFNLGEVENGGAVNFDDSGWRSVNVPHDWSVEHPFSEKNEGCTGYLPGGIGWYRLKFTADPAKVNVLHFDGVYNNSSVFLNGEKLGDHPYGYSPFWFDISDKVKTDGSENVLAVRVDHSRFADSRWYTGSGIYRKVELISTDKLHVPMWGSFVTTPEVSAAKATVKIAVEICNKTGAETEAEITTRLIAPSGETAGETAAKKTGVKPGETVECEQTAEIENPLLWDIDSPHLYKAVTTVSSGGQQTDEYTTVFGIRSIRFDAEKGFFLNGKHTYIKGVCLHHDGGCVGAAVPRDVWRRRFAKLKEAGVNAIRIAHNPGSDEFITLCDEMGLLVQDEFFDEWDNPKDKRKNMNQQSEDYLTESYTKHFQEKAESDLKAVMRSHRNHPSIFQWSIGNEIEWTYPRNAEATGFFDADWSGNYFWEQPPHSIDEIKRLLTELPRGEYDIGETAQKLSKWTKEIDTTRPVIANCILPSSSYQSGYADALDVIGFSYRRVMYDYGHKHWPNLPLMGTENLAQWHEWKAIIERPFVSGTFLWTGIDYMGEVNGQWPKKTLNCGLLDTAGFEGGSFHMMKTLWNDEPHVHLTTQTLEKSPYIFDAETGFIGEEDAEAWQRKLWIWHNINTHWNYTEGETIAVEVYSNCESVELFLNGESLGRKQLADFDDRIYKWAVPFKPGKLEAKASNASDRIETAGKAAAISLLADGCHVIAQLVDEAGRPVKTEEREITFTLSDGGRILGVDNGNAFSTQDFQSDHITTFEGRCLLVVETETTVTVGATSGELVGKPVIVGETA